MNQIVLGIEVAVERHLVGAGRLGDRLDADAANAVAMEKILRRRDDPVARAWDARGRPRRRSSLALQFFSRMALDFDVTDRYQSALPAGNMAGATSQ